MWRSAASALSPVILRRVASSAAAPSLSILPALFLRPISSAPLYLPPPATFARSASFQFFAGGPRTFATRGRRAAPDSEDEDEDDFDGDSDDVDEGMEKFDDSDDDEDDDGIDSDEVPDD